MLEVVIAAALAYLALGFMAVLALLPVAVIAFVVLVAVRDWVEDRSNETLRELLTLALVPVVAAFLVLDVLFNLTWGTYYFRELPAYRAADGRLRMREWLFTSRVERHYRTCAFAGSWEAPTYVHATTPQQLAAVRWADFLNDVDPRHVTMLAGALPSFVQV